MTPPNKKRKREVNIKPVSPGALTPARLAAIARRKGCTPAQSKKGQSGEAETPAPKTAQSIITKLETPETEVLTHKTPNGTRKQRKDATRQTILKKTQALEAKADAPSTKIMDSGDQPWHQLSRRGPKASFNTSEELVDKAFDYFQWAHDHPILDLRGGRSNGLVMIIQDPKVRLLTIGGLCLHLNVSRDTWSNYRKKEDFKDAVEMIELYMGVRKYEYASVGMLNSNIVGKDIENLNTPTEEPIKRITRTIIDVAKPKTQSEPEPEADPEAEPMTKGQSFFTL